MAPWFLLVNDLWRLERLFELYCKEMQWRNYNINSNVINLEMEEVTFYICLNKLNILSSSFGNIWMFYKIIETWRFDLILSINVDYSPIF